MGYCPDLEVRHMDRFDTAGNPRARARWSYLLALVLALALAASACAQDEDAAEPDPGVDDDAGVVDEAPDDDVDAPDDDDDVDAPDDEVAAGCDPEDPIQIGVVFSLTGPAADIGARGREGVDMAVEELNAENGILGRCVEALVRDDEGDPTRASQVTRELVDQEEVDFVVGPFLSSPAGTSIEVTNQANMVHIQGSVLFEAGDPEQFPYVFRVQVAAHLQAETFTQFMQEAGYESAGVIAVNNALGIGVSEAFQASAEEAGLEVTTVEFHESGDTDHTVQMQTIQGTDPDVLIVMSTATPDLVASVRARNGLGWDVPVLGFSSMAFVEVTEAIGFDGMEGVLAGQAFRNFSRDSDGNVLGGERIIDWLERYRVFIGADEIQFGPQQVASFYDAVIMLAEAVEGTGSVEDEEIRDYLQANPHEGIMATYVYDEQRHDGVTFDDLVFVIARSLEDGTYELAEEQQ
jgi:branched-chain amino acid transport system substrate-binding protein